MTNVCPFPIAVLSFNRPDLLTPVLQSLKEQTIGVDASRVYLFQDGAQSRFTETPADDTLQNECVKRFQDIFPDGQVYQSPVNLGIALNFDRAERLFFEELKAECGLFFEDDLVLSPHYLDALLQLADFALAEPLVGYVAAYGDHTAALAKQQATPSKVMVMAHNWGFALTRRQWLRQRDIVEGYLSIVRNSEYARRDVKRIKEYYASFGFTVSGSSQDAAKGVASYVLGTTRLMCLPCFGRYIGKVGTHFSAELYEKYGYDKTELFDGAPPRFEFPSRPELMSWIAAEQSWSRRQLSQSATKERLKESLPQLSDVTIQTNALEFVDSLYVSLLDRPADPPGAAAWVNALKAGKSPSDIVRSFVRSAEYKSKIAQKLNLFDTAVARPDETGVIVDKYIYFGNLLPSEQQYKSDRFIGLALSKKYDKDIAHDATKPLPFADESVIGFQSQDVFEHIDLSAIPKIFDDIYRCLRPGALFRLSAPDYNSPLLKNRSVYNAEGAILCDLAMGGKVSAIDGAIDVSFAPSGAAHIWFPTYDKILRLIVSSEIRKCASIKIHHAWFDAVDYVCDDFDQTIMPVTRSPPHDMRAAGKPISIVVDFIK